MNPIFNGVYRLQSKIWTQNLVPHTRVYGESLIEHAQIEYRNWNPFQSKLAAAIQNGLRQFPIEPDSKILYLGSAEGTTISHLSDILRGKGLIIGIDVSARTMSKILQLASERPHILPIIADAGKPDIYPSEIQEISFDFLYQDIAQKNQTEIFIRNARFLKKDGFGMLVIKAPSIDSQKPAKTVIQEQLQMLEKEFKIIQTLSLEPFEKKHALVLCQKK